MSFLYLFYLELQTAISRSVSVMLVIRLFIALEN